jgi:hypothetical protein
MLKCWNAAMCYFGRNSQYFKYSHKTLKMSLRNVKKSIIHNTVKVGYYNENKIKMSLSKFKTNSMFLSHDTRTKSDLFITSHNTKLFEQSIAYNGLLVYNKLPNKIKSVKSIIKFKKILRNFLLERVFIRWKNL